MRHRLLRVIFIFHSRKVPCTLLLMLLTSKSGLDKCYRPIYRQNVGVVCICTNDLIKHSNNMCFSKHGTIGTQFVYILSYKSLT